MAPSTAASRGCPVAKSLPRTVPQAGRGVGFWAPRDQTDAAMGGARGGAAGPMGGCCTLQRGGSSARAEVECHWLFKRGVSECSDIHSLA